MLELIDIRDELYLRIAVKKTALGFVYNNNNFVLEKAWEPSELLEDLRTIFPYGKCYVIAMSSDDDNNAARSNLCRHEMVVQIAFQHYLEESATVADIDNLVKFVGELKTVCREEMALPNFHWLRNESFRDENGIPMAFVGLRKGIFEAYFLAYYVTILGG